MNPASLSKTEFANHWFQRVWTEGDPAAVDEMMAPTARIEGFANAATVGTEAFKAFQKSLLARLSDIRFTTLRVIEQDGWTAILWSMSAVCKLTGKPVASTGTIFAEIRNGQFTGGYNHFDTLGLYQDIGLLPADTVPRLFEGRSLA